MDLEVFNEKFVEANIAMSSGNLEGLKKGISLLVDSLSVAGLYVQDIRSAIDFLSIALSCHERAQKGPWNIGYGVIAWKNDLWERDEALKEAWTHIKAVNDKLVEKGLGWNY